MTVTNNLPARHERALLALMHSPTIGQAAELAGISEPTIHRWLRDPAFAAAYRAARNQAVEQAIGRLQQTTSDAVSTIECVMNDPENPAGVRLRAAETVLNTALRAIELFDLETRMAALESQLEANR